MSASEAIMVSPEQSATAPKSLVAKAAPAKTSTTRLVLLAVLALAAATGAMFGAVVLGNQLTQELHPKGSSHLNSVTLVDSEDRAIATTAVESYVSLLDLPLLGTAELNKVDGITFSTSRGIEHRKVTGYTVTAETAYVDHSKVQTPRLSLATSTPGASVEVSVRDNKAWLSETDGGSTTVTAIDTSSQRRLADGGSCLESGACLYSRDELLRLDAASRRLEEGSFFARADVAAYQVELSGDLMQYLEGTGDVATLDGTHTEDGRTFRLRFEQLPAGNRFLFTNYTSGESKLVTSKGSFIFSASGRLVRCNVVSGGMQEIDQLSVDRVAKLVAFDTLDVTHGTTQKIIPFEASVTDCQDLTIKQANLTTPEALERFPDLAEGAQKSSPEDILEVKKQLYGVQTRRSLAATASKVETAIKAQMDANDLLSMMTNAASGRQMTMEELTHPDQKRVLKSARAKSHADRELSVTLTSFDLWVATRIADPSVKTAGYSFGVNPAADPFFTAATEDGLGPELSMDLSGVMGVSTAFVEWSGFHYYAGYSAVAAGTVSEMLLMGANSGVCAGGVNKFSKPLPQEIVAASCSSYEVVEFSPNEELLEAVKKDTPCDCKAFLDEIDDCAGVETEFCLEATYGKVHPEMYMRKCEMAAMMEREAIERIPLPGLDDRRGAEPMISDFDVKMEMKREELMRAEIEEKGFFDECPPDEKFDYIPCEDKAHGLLPKCMPFIEKYSHYMRDPSVKVVEVCSRRRNLKETRELAPATDPLLAPSAYASLLYKTKGSGTEKYVVSFQGTKMDEPAMVQYTTKKDPMLLPWEGEYVTTTEGYAMYSAATFPCITSLYKKIPSVEYVTGHSIGGAAATIFEATVAKGSSVLVTFGAPAVFAPFGFNLAKTKGVYSVTGDGVALVNDGLGGFESVTLKDAAKITAKMVGIRRNLRPAATVTSSFIPPSSSTTSVSGIRYFHKFDPVPGYYWGLGWKHGVSTAYMMYDTEGGCSGSTFSVGGGYIKEDHDGDGSIGTVSSDISKLKSFLCTDYDTTPNTVLKPVDYYSYTNAVNPFPCSEVLAATTYSYFAGLGISVAGMSYWNPGETLLECAETWLATTEAYTATYLTSGLITENPHYTLSLDYSAHFLLVFYTYFGLLWIHMTYPYYELPL